MSVAIALVVLTLALLVISRRSSRARSKGPDAKALDTLLAPYTSPRPQLPSYRYPGSRGSM